MVRGGIGNSRVQTPPPKINAHAKGGGLFLRPRICSEGYSRYWFALQLLSRAMLYWARAPTCKLRPREILSIHLHVLQIIILQNKKLYHHITTTLSNVAPFYIYRHEGSANGDFNLSCYAIRRRWMAHLFQPKSSIIITISINFESRW